ncbi:ABATE domain-containing protein [Streptomyces sp. NPDC085460]|uniref:ABATE domain-containing protein n=1 Tax=Streptomyces sp. NPDC085460 TaxID=3365723 RepID=UPI0037D881E6
MALGGEDERRLVQGALVDPDATPERVQRVEPQFLVVREVLVKGVRGAREVRGHLDLGGELVGDLLGDGQFDRHGHFLFDVLGLWSLGVHHQARQRQRVPGRIVPLPGGVGEDVEPDAQGVEVAEEVEQDVGVTGVALLPGGPQRRVRDVRELFRQVFEHVQDGAADGPDAVEVEIAVVRAAAQDQVGGVRVHVGQGGGESGGQAARLGPGVGECAAALLRGGVHRVSWSR